MLFYEMAEPEQLRTFSKNKLWDTGCFNQYSDIFLHLIQFYHFLKIQNHDHVKNQYTHEFFLI